MAVKSYFAGLDKLLVFLVLVASAFGLLMVNSATRFTVSEGSLFSRDFKAMLIALLLGLLLALAISVIDYEWIGKLWPIIGIFCILLMLFTRIFGVAPDERLDARSWIDLGGFFFQSSELVKIGFIITYSMHIELVKDRLNKLKSIIALGIHAALAAGLVVLCGDLGSAVIFLLVALGLLFFAGLHWGYFASLAVITAAASPLIWLYLLGDFQKRRFLALISPELYPDEIYQQEKGITALGSGKLFGQGLFEGAYTQNGVVPEAENDMIFSVIGEELGFVGCVLALLLLAGIVAKIMKVGKNAQDFSAKLIGYAVAVMIVSQVIINIGMCLKLLPVIGITLPFFSAGGSSTLCLYIGLGLVLSIHRYNRRQNMINFSLSNIRTPFAEYT
ncbi:MAG: Rod shape-determining protein RodA [Firmicutes bacterium ADurb.Bin300]|nr:MAG: Rod shape-determining protein RodA [Firmicutes bacterium ADurb.Bin300]HOD02118.1 FtsW/RodA/SpoVE family cell cycle protein [Clostridiales bacterium]